MGVKGIVININATLKLLYLSEFINNFYKTQTYKEIHALFS